MIARTWRGWTRTDDAEEYAAYIKSTGLAAYTSTPGNRGAFLLHRSQGDRTEFIALSFWDDLDAIAGFAGDNIDAAVFYPEDDRYLIDRETTVRHYTVTEPRLERGPLASIKDASRGRGGGGSDGEFGDGGRRFAADGRR